MSKAEVFTIERFPTNIDELKDLSVSGMKTPFETAALAVAVMCNYEKDVEATIDMINYIKGPANLSEYDRQFLRDRLGDKGYIPRSYFIGACPENDYEPSKPYQIEVFDNPYSYQNEGYATLYIRSSGADSPRQVQLRRKGDQWFLWQILFLSDIRKPASEDEWA